MHKNTKRPIRRKPDRPQQQTDYIIYGLWDEYMPPWGVTFCGAAVGLAAAFLPMLLGFGRMQGWW